MATAKVTLVPIVLDKARNIRFDLNALAEAEAKTGKNFLDEKSWQNLSATDVRAVLYACLKHEDPDLTIEAIGALLDPSNIGEVLLGLTAAYEAAMPAPKDGDAPLPTTQAPAK